MKAMALEPIILKNLPNIPSRTSKPLPILKLFSCHYLLFLYYYLTFYCVSNNDISKATYVQLYAYGRLYLSHIHT